MAESTNYNTTPGTTITVALPGEDSGLDMGFQVVKAVNGSIAVGRTTVGVAEVPAASGNYVATFVAPAEPDLYLVIFDWNAGVLEPGTSHTDELIVQGLASTVQSTGLGTVADHTRLAIGASNWNGLYNDSSFGPDLITLSIEAVKARVSSTELVEQNLPLPVLSYLGKLVGLQLIPALRAWWAAQIISQSIGDDPVEVVSYASRDRMMDALQDTLARQAAAEAPLALELLPDPILMSADDGPAIDEDDLSHYVTNDPRDFPAMDEYPLHEHAVTNRARYHRQAI